MPSLEAISHYAIMFAYDVHKISVSMTRTPNSICFELFSVDCFVNEYYIIVNNWRFFPFSVGRSTYFALYIGHF